MNRSIKSCFFIIIVIVFIKDSIVCLPFGGTWRQVGSDINGKAAFDFFGGSVALSADGKTIVIGGELSDSMKGSGRAGQVSVYTINSTSGDWTQLGSSIDGKGLYDFFGWSVCISEDGKTIAVGAPGRDEKANDSGQTSVYSYNSSLNMWVQVGSDINGERVNDQSGYSIDISADGKTISIGAPFNSSPNREFSGHVRVYTINTTSGNWTQVGADIDGEASFNSFGDSVAMSSDGRIIVIGAPDNDNESGANAGHVRVFSTNSTSTIWTQVGSDIDGKTAEGKFGTTVATSLDGKTIAIGDFGYVRVYAFNGTSGNWTQLGADINGLGQSNGFKQSGRSIEMSADGKTFAVGTPDYDSANGTESGLVRVYSMNSTSGNWTQVGLDIIGEAMGDESGYSIAISNDGFTLAIGAPLNKNINGQSGHVRVYKYELPPTKAPTRMPTKSPTKVPTKFPTRTPTKATSKLPTKRPTKAPTKAPTRRPTKNPTKHPSKSPTRTPSKSPTKRPASALTKSPTKKPTKSPTKAPSQVLLPVSIPIMVPIQSPLTSPATVPTNCGLFHLNFFCPRRGECGFWRRLLNLRGC